MDGTTLFLPHEITTLNFFDILFLKTKSFNIDDLSKEINVYKNEGDFYEF